MARITGYRRTKDMRLGTLDSIAGDRRQEDRRTGEGEKGPQETRRLEAGRMRTEDKRQESGGTRHRRQETGGKDTGEIRRRSSRQDNRRNGDPKQEKGEQGARDRRAG